MAKDNIQNQNPATAAEKPEVLRFVPDDNRVVKTGLFESPRYSKEEASKVKDAFAGKIRSLQVSSIPSPFARLDLVKTAFEEVCNTENNGPIDGMEFYHKIVSETLDVGELFFNKTFLGENAGITKWVCEQHSGDLAEMLKSGDPKHRNLGKTLQLFIEQDKTAYNFAASENAQPAFTLYFFKYKHKLLGGISPATLFFSAPNPDLAKILGENIRFGSNKLFDPQQPCPLYKRDPAFVSFIVSLFLAENGYLRGKMVEFWKYVEANLTILENADHAFWMELKNIDGDHYRNRYETLDEKPGGTSNPIRILDRIDLKGNKETSFKSDFFIKSTKADALPQEERPLALPYEATVKKYAYHNQIAWKDGFEKGVKHFDPLPMKERSLPGLDSTRHPYLTSCDIFEDYLIRFPYKIDSGKYFTGYAATGDFGVLPPIKKEYFKYFSLEDLKKNLTIKDLNKGAAFEVSLMIPIGKGESIRFSRFYRAGGLETRQEGEVAHLTGLKTAPKENNEGYWIELPMSVAMFPFVKNLQSVARKTLLVDANKEGFFKEIDFGLSFYQDGPTGAAALNTGVYEKTSKHHANASASVRAFSFKESFDFALLQSAFGLNELNALLIPNFPNPQETNGKYIFSIDFGTSFTHVECSKDGKPPYAFELDPKDSYAATGMKTELETALEQEFMPQSIKTGSLFFFPQRTALSHTGSLPASPQALKNVNIPFAFEKKQTNAHLNITTGFKWPSNEVGGEDAGRAERAAARSAKTRSFLENIFLLMAGKVLAEGGLLKNVDIVFSYPFSMVQEAGGLKSIMEGLCAEYGFQKPTPVCESTAPFYYYDKQGVYAGLNSSVVSIDIGGGTTDIAIFEGDRVKAITSFKFGANALFGDGYGKPVSQNLFYKTYFEHVRRKLGRELAEELDDIVSKGRSSTDMVSLFFSLDKKVYDFAGDLKLNPNWTFLVCFYYSAIIYHLAQVMKAKNLALPKHLTFSGTGSKVLKILSLTDEQIATFTMQLFEAFLGAPMNMMALQVHHNDSPKEITAKGTVLFEQSKGKFADMESRIEQFAVTLPGAPGMEEGKTYESITEYDRNAITAEVAVFIDTFFKVYGENPAYKKTLMENLRDHLDRGISNKAEEGGKGKMPIKETMFFYPLVGALQQLASTMGK